ncbi:MAG: hypothetical protein WA001_00695 [Patescibacteria group bacterium]
MASKKRPELITAICILEFIALVFGSAVFFEASKFFSGFPVIAGWALVYVLTLDVLRLVSCIGLWMMKKWGLFLYIVLTGAGIIYAALQQQWSVAFLAIIVPAVVIFAGFSYYRQMD